MRLWRISDYATLSGEGTERYAARWHMAGHRIVYTAATPSGAMLEVLVHLELNGDELPEHYQLLEISAPDDLAITGITPQDQHAEGDWRLDIAQSRALGTAWLRSGSSALASVPSAILPDTRNYLLNPSHPDAALIKVQSAASARYDQRLFKKMRG